MVELEDDDRLKHVGVCLLSVDVDAVKMYELNAGAAELVSWPIGSIRRFGFEPLRFTIETGRCDQQCGIITFRVSRRPVCRRYIGLPRYCSLGSDVKCHSAGGVSAVVVV